MWFWVIGRINTPPDKAKIERVLKTLRGLNRELCGKLSGDPFVIPSEMAPPRPRIPSTWAEFNADIDRAIINDEAYHGIVTIGIFPYISEAKGDAIVLITSSRRSDISEEDDTLRKFRKRYEDHFESKTLVEPGRIPVTMHFGEPKAVLWQRRHSYLHTIEENQNALDFLSTNIVLGLG